MQSRLDWISFTLDIDKEPLTAASAEHSWRSRLRRHDPDLYEMIAGEGEFHYRNGRPPYKYGFQRHDNACIVFIGSNTSTMLVELTGHFFDSFTQFEEQQKIISGIAHCVTRVDFATDMRTETRPAAFANERNKAQRVAVGFFSSPTGETVYLGSQKSDRFCRIYRYSPPHPRADFLRFEVVYRRGYAKSFADAFIRAASPVELQNAAAEPYAFTSKDWQPGSEDSVDITLPTTTRDEDKTIYWLYSSVVPAIARVLVTQALDWSDFLEQIDNRVDELRSSQR